MSPAEREQLGALLDDYYALFLEDVAAARGLDADSLRWLINHGPYDAADALAHHLVDAVIYPDELESRLNDLCGGKVQIKSYSKIADRQVYQTAWNYETQSSAAVALIYATGTIHSGKSKGAFSDPTCGAETICKAIRQARKDKSVKAIVLRVDSPGGSGSASDLIWRELHLTTTADQPKPVIVSMSGVAASGGYYIACPADTILANRATLTGSIGVFSGKFNVAALLDKIGVNAVTIKRGEHAGLWSPYESASAEERRIIRDLNESQYTLFVERVADGRALPAGRVRELGGGRIYSGRAAIENGLVDLEGGLKDAIRIACEMGGVPDYRRVPLKVLPRWWGSILNLETGDLETRLELLESVLPARYHLARSYFNAWLYNYDDYSLMLMPYWVIFE